MIFVDIPTTCTPLLISIPVCRTVPEFALAANNRPQNVAAEIDAAIMSGSLIFAGSSGKRRGHPVGGTAPSYSECYPSCAPTVAVWNEATSSHHSRHKAASTPSALPSGHPPSPTPRGSALILNPDLPRAIPCTGGFGFHVGSAVGHNKWRRIVLLSSFTPGLSFSPRRPYYTYLIGNPFRRGVIVITIRSSVGNYRLSFRGRSDTIRAVLGTFHCEDSPTYNHRTFRPNNTIYFIEISPPVTV